MINYIFGNLDGRVKSALYADDGAIWMRGRNVPYVMENIKKAIGEVEKWSYEWGFKMSTSKLCYMIFTKKQHIAKKSLTLYGQPMERVN